MRFLVDAQLPLALCRWLEARGHAADHVADVGLLAASDAEIADRAEAGAAILVSKDEDFVVLRLPDRFAFLWLRCGNATNRALALWLDARWERIESLLATGERIVEAR
jgi:predicted nuclease of predicted toxin-antitoxin system